MLYFIGPEYGGEEIACGSESGGDITTGGGFSTLFRAGSYQRDAVSGYFNSLKLNEMPKEGFDPLGRAYPDVAIVGHNYEVVIGGKTYLVGTVISFHIMTVS